MSGVVAPATTTEELVKRYSAAWRDHDIDRIIEMHTDDTEYQSHDGSARITGRAAVREAFVALLETYPDLEIEPVRVRVVDDVIVHECHSITTPPGASAAVKVDGVDVITVRGGLVHTKDTYLDTAGLTP